MTVNVILTPELQSPNYCQTIKLMEGETSCEAAASLTYNIGLILSQTRFNNVNTMSVLHGLLVK